MTSQSPPLTASRPNARCTAHPHDMSSRSWLRRLPCQEPAAQACAANPDVCVALALTPTMHRRSQAQAGTARGAVRPAAAHRSAHCRAGTCSWLRPTGYQVGSGCCSGPRVTCSTAPPAAATMQICTYPPLLLANAISEPSGTTLATDRACSLIPDMPPGDACDGATDQRDRVRLDLFEHKQGYCH